MASTRRCDLLIVGAGMPSLHLISRLPPSVLQSTLVVDASGEWLGSWATSLAACGSETLRSPVSHSPHTEPGALAKYAAANKRQQELVVSNPQFAPLPSVALLRDFCAHSLATGASPRLLQDTVTQILPLPDGAGCRVLLASGEEISARTVVYTCPRLQPVVPHWAQACLPPPAANGNRMSTGTAAPGQQAPASQGGRLRLAREVDVRKAPLAGRRIAVVGGGMTAASLALAACSHGAAAVLLASRARLRVQEAVCDPGWCGIKLLRGFSQVASWQERMRLCRAARPQASVNRLTHTALVAAAASGKLRIAEGTRVVAAAATGGGVQLQTAPPPAGASEQQEEWEEVWLATGCALDVSADPVLGRLLDAHPTQVVGGYPVLTDALAWPGLPLFLPGRAALLHTGPMAGEMAGLRAATDIVAEALTAVLFCGAHEGPLPWEAAPRVTEGPELPLEGTEAAQQQQQQAAAKTLAGPEAGGSLETAGLPRRQISSYSWQDEGFQLRVTFRFDEPLQERQVEALFGPASFELQAVTAGAVHHCRVPRLYGRVLPERCRALMRGRRVSLLLQKVSDQEWRFLRG